MESGHRREHLIFAIGFITGRQIAGHPEGKFCFGDTHVVRAECQGGAVLMNHLRQKPPGERAIDRDMPLAGETRGGDLPAEERPGAQIVDLRLDQIPLGAGFGPQRERQFHQGRAVPPMSDQQLRCVLRLSQLHGLPPSKNSDNMIFPATPPY